MLKLMHVLTLVKRLLIKILDLTLFRMSFFGAAHGWGGGHKGAPSLKSVTHILQ